MLNKKTSVPAEDPVMFVLVPLKPTKGDSQSFKKFPTIPVTSA